MGDPKTTWGAAEYPLMAQALEPVSAQVIEDAGVTARDRVIDVATGTGNAALLAAAHGASVVGVDIEPALLALARARAQASGKEIAFIEGKAEALPLANGEADVVLSVFGVMYALDHAAAARELVRVLAPSGRIALAAWVPGSLMPAMGAVTAKYLPPAPLASAPPGRWGDPESLRALLADAGAELRAGWSDRLSLPFDHAQAAADFLIRTAGHIVSQRGQLIASGRWLPLRQDLATFVEQHGEQQDDGLVLHLDYSVILADRA